MRIKSRSADIRSIYNFLHRNLIIIFFRKQRRKCRKKQKVESIAALQATGKTVCMIGYGVNDALALKSADIGVAMGSMGSDIAIDATDIALMGDDISKIPYLKRLSVEPSKPALPFLCSSIWLPYAFP